MLFIKISKVNTHFYCEHYFLLYSNLIDDNIWLLVTLKFENFTLFIKVPKINSFFYYEYYHLLYSSFINNSLQLPNYF